MSPGSMRRALGACALVALGWGCGGESGAGRAFPVPGDRAPRISVEVFNASGQDGLARAGVRALRRAGIDVVYYGNATPGSGVRDSTRILVRRGDAALGQRVREALGAGRVAAEPDPDRLVDVSVLLGADFVPRREFNP